jgi:hypothetical protein
VEAVHKNYDVKFVAARSNDLLWCYTLKFQQLPLQNIVQVLEYEDGSYNGLNNEEYQEFILKAWKKETVKKLVEGKVTREDVIPS